MSIKDDIARQEKRKKEMNGLFKTKAEPKMRISTKQRIEQAEKAQMKRILQALHDGKRTLPKGWERGYNAAVTAVELALSEK